MRKIARAIRHWVQQHAAMRRSPRDKQSRLQPQKVDLADLLSWYPKYPHQAGHLFDNQSAQSLLFWTRFPSSARRNP